MKKLLLTAVAVLALAGCVKDKVYPATVHCRVAGNDVVLDVQDQRMTGNDLEVWTRGNRFSYTAEREKITFDPATQCRVEPKAPIEMEHN